jgi:uncharacterized membrane protein
MRLPKQKEFFILVLCILIGFALRFYAFDQKSLWIDEIHTLNDSKDDFEGQIKYFKENPTNLHPPLFYILTHLFHPFTKPERDLRILPLIFGTLSIPMIYFLARSLSPPLALPCTLSLTFMAYHIYFSQEARSYSMLMFFGMLALYFFIHHLKTYKKRYLFCVAFLLAILFYTSYSAILFIIFFQLLWFYNIKENGSKPAFSSFLTLNGLLFLICIPWLLFLVLNYKGQPIMDPHHTEGTGSLESILYWVFNDWVSNLPLIIISVTLLFVFPFFSKHKRNALILLAALILPIGSLYLFCKLFQVTHFFASKYFIIFLPLFFISIYFSLHSIEMTFERLKTFMRLKIFFAILFIASNLMVLPLYYQSEKQDFRGLANYLKGQLRDGDKIFVNMKAYLPGILHYLGARPQGRHFNVSLSKDIEGGVECHMVSSAPKMVITLYHSKTCCAQYAVDGSRLWIIVEKWTAKKFKENSPCVFMGYFDGSFANFRKFPTDASMYLFLWDPKSPDQKGLNLTTE